MEILIYRLYHRQNQVEIKMKRQIDHIPRGCHIYLPSDLNKLVQVPKLQFGLLVAVLDWLTVKFKMHLDDELSGISLRIIAVKYCGAYPAIGLYVHSFEKAQTFDPDKIDVDLNKHCSELFRREPISELLDHICLPDKKWNQIWDWLQSGIIDPNHELANTNSKQFDPEKLCDMGSSIKIIGEISDVTSTDIAIGPRQNIRIINYRDYFYAESIWIGLYVSVSGILRRSASPSVYDLIPDAEQLQRIYPSK